MQPCGAENGRRFLTRDLGRQEFHIEILPIDLERQEFHMEILPIGLERQKFHMEFLSIGLGGGESCLVSASF